MSPRPRKASDNEVFGAAMRVMSRVGPADLTLSAIAAEAGLTPGALVQRFGSKQQLLRTISSQLGAAAPEIFADLRRAHPSPLAALREYALCQAQLAESPDALARNLAYLQLDLTDPELYQGLLRYAKGTRAQLAGLVKAAIAAGELSSAARPGQLARLIEVTLSGSLMTWAIYRDGTAARWMLADLDAVLRPYLNASQSTPQTPRRTSGAASAARRW
jgi:AcrR family transcriptional regulator